jgi:hypothetical protein
MLNVSMFVVGWLLFLLAQMQNSVRSTSNGLDGLTGMKKWFRLQAVNILTRAFFSAALYPTLLKAALDKLDGPLHSAGLSIAAWGLAGFAGYMANTAMFQIFGLIPGLRVEIPALVPPAAVNPTPPPAVQ